MELLPLDTNISSETIKDFGRQRVKISGTITAYITRTIIQKGITPNSLLHTTHTAYLVEYPKNETTTPFDTHHEVFIDDKSIEILAEDAKLGLELLRWNA